MENMANRHDIIRTVFMILLFSELSYAEENTRLEVRHVDLKDMPDALNTDHDSRYLLKELVEEDTPDTPTANRARIWLDTKSNDLMIRFDTGDSIVIGEYQ